MKTEMNHHEIVKKLIGPIRPVGETNEDHLRYENLKLTMELIQRLLDDVADVANTHHNGEYSIKRSCDLASNFLRLLTQ